MTMTFPSIPTKPYADAIQAYQEMVAKRDQANAEIARLRGTRRAAQREDGTYHWLGGELERAVDADDADRAHARLTGSKDPGEKRADKVRGQISDLLDQERILTRAVVEAEDQVAAALVDREAIAEACDAVVAAKRDQYADALQDLIAAREAFWSATQARTWATAFPAECRAFSPGQPPRLARLSHLSQNGEGFDAAIVLNELSSEVVSPEPVKAHRYEQVNEVMLTPGGVPEGTVRGWRRVEAEPQPVGAVATSGLSVDGVPVFMDLGSGDGD